MNNYIEYQEECKKVINIYRLEMGMSE